MFADYERLVVDDYQRKKSQNALLSGLMHPTQAKLKKECERLCKSKIHNKDEKVIRDFCEEWDNTKTCLQNIEKCDVDKFKPLANFLKGNTGSTDPRNIHLLAWLIDFPHRPFDLRKDYTSLKEIQDGFDDTETVEGANVEVPLFSEEPQAVDIEKKNKFIEIQKEVDESTENIGVKENAANNTSVSSQSLIRTLTQRWRFRKVVVAGVLLAVTGTGGFWWWEKTHPAYIMPENGSCMYWADDHFQPIPCNQKIPNTLVVALDTAKVKNFKKITRPDTITHQAKGHVWYSKINMKIEFFTADGTHPVVIGRRLKPITDYIINKYIHPGMALEQAK